jgi:hypothetical protein
MSPFFPPFLAVLLVGLEVALAPDTSIAIVSLPQDLQAKYGADERTRTADLLITSDRSGVAGVCRGLQIPHI